MKKIIILILILILVVIGARFFFIFKKDPEVVQNIVNYIPFGLGGQTNNTPNTNNTNTSYPTDNIDVGYISTSTNTVPTVDENKPVPRFRKIAEAVAGYVVTNKQIRYAERATGHVYETTTDSLKTERLTNTTMPAIQEAFFTNNGNTVILRSLNDTDTIKTYVGDIVNSNSTSSGQVLGSLRGDYIDDNISFLAVSPNTQNIFVLKEGQNGATGFVADAKANNPKLVFSSKAKEWYPSWTNNDLILLTSRASGGISGMSISLNTKTGAQETVLSGYLGLTAKMNPANTKVLFSTSGKSGVQKTFIADKINTSSSTAITRVTLPEKCTWPNKAGQNIVCLMSDSTQSGQFPDEWYQGVKGFIDNIFYVNTNTGILTLVYQPIASQMAVDGIRPTLSSDDTYLFFMDKISGDLWSYRLVE